MNLTVQHLGSSCTQLADQEPGFGLIAITPPAGAARMRNFGDLTITEFRFDPELPSCEIDNLRVGYPTNQSRTCGVTLRSSF